MLFTKLLIFVDLELNLEKQLRKLRKLIREIASKDGFHVDEYFTGHGIGKHLHMKPSIFHSLFKNTNEQFIEEGMVFTIEPIITLFPHDKIYIWKDQFTIISENNPSAQMEHMVYINDNGPEILTQFN